MGLFSDLFSQNNSADEHIPAIMPPGALDQIRQGIIPTMRTDRIMLTQGEVCHFSERAILMTEKTQKRYVGNSSGFSFRVCKGVTYRTGQRRGRPIEETYTEKNKGLLYVTNKRIIFVSDKNAFDKKLKSLTAITPYSNAVQLRFLYKGIIIKHNKTEPTYTKTSLFLCEKRRFFMARTEKGVVTTI